MMSREIMVNNGNNSREVLWLRLEFGLRGAQNLRLLGKISFDWLANHYWLFQFRRWIAKNQISLSLLTRNSRINQRASVFIFRYFSARELLSELDHLVSEWKWVKCSQTKRIQLRWRKFPFRLWKSALIGIIFGEEIFAHPIVSTFIPLAAKAYFMQLIKAQRTLIVLCFSGALRRSIFVLCGKHCAILRQLIGR
jgi:hypothetical protein